MPSYLRNRLLLIAVFSLAAVALCHAQNSEKTKVPRIGIINITTGWKQLGDSSIENLTKLRDAGINTIVIWVSPYRPGYPDSSKNPQWWNDPESIEKLAQVGQRCNKVGLDLYWMGYMGVGIDFYPHVKLKPSLDHEGKGKRSPSWLDPEYWHKVLIPRDSALAKLVKRGLAKGVLLEPEVYADGALMERGQIDFGDVAYSRFMQSIGLKGNLPKPADRATNLLKTGLIGPYVEWQAQELKSFSKERKDALQKIAPNIQLGFYMPGATHSLWMKSLAQGMNDPRQPMLIMDATTYFAFAKNWFLNWEMHSIAEYAQYEEQLFKQWGINAHSAFGIWTYPGETYKNNPMYQKVFDPKGITKFFQDAVATGHGWWIWNEVGNPEKIIQSIKESEKR